MLDSELGRVARGAIALGCLALDILVPRAASAQTNPAPSRDEQLPAERAADSQDAPKINLSGGSHMDLSQPAPPPLGQRTYQYHEGFYARLDAGLGALFGAKVSGGLADVTSSGLELDYDLLIGGTPAPGFVLGGAVVGGLQLTGDWEADGTKVADANLNTLIIGPFAEGFPQPNGNLHFGGTVGLSHQGVDVAGTSGGTSAWGVGGAFWAGTGVWVAPDWSVGGLLRLQALYGKDGDLTVTSFGASLMFAVTYN
jgi:hypothetical protein